MVVGFNHNFRYKGEIYHIQTEDSGLRSPNIVTLLYQGGTILASKKTSYADITKVDNLEQVVEELMKEQHKSMLRSLKVGEFDAVIDRFQANRSGSRRNADAEPLPAASLQASPNAAGTSTASAVAAAANPAPVRKPESTDTPDSEPSAATVGDGDSPADDVSLDEVILSYLIGDNK